MNQAISEHVSLLRQLSEMTTVVADTGDLEAIRQFKPIDATTNPSLITAAAKQAINAGIIQDALAQAKQEGLSGINSIERAIDLLTVALGIQILKVIDGRVSTEVDARLSFDTEATVAKAKELIALYQAAGIDSSRVLIKIAATWEGIQAAKQLEQAGIHCNLTLLFGLHQAVACADAGVRLISPFVGRILDWYKKAEGVTSYPIDKDPGVASVKQIYAYYKQHDIKTQVMGASFRSCEQVLALAGCDLLTISPNLLQELQTMQGILKPALSMDNLGEPIAKITMDKATFDTQHAQNPMAKELLQAGIEGFIKAREQLVEALLDK